MDAKWVYTAKSSLPSHAARMIAYATAFIDPNICDVRIENEALVIECEKEIDSGKLDKGVARLCARFANAEQMPTETVFALVPDEDETHPNGIASQNVFSQIAPGLIVVREPHGSLLTFLDWAVTERFAKPFSAREEFYPNVIPVQTLAKTQHLSSFPEHLQFISHLHEDLDIIEAYASQAKDTSRDLAPASRELAASTLVHNPSTCYHCYAARDGERLEKNEVVTAITKCHRYESSNHSNPGRLLEFSLREVIFLGSGDFVRHQRKECLDLVQKWAEDWGLFGELLSASDPFFTDDFEAKTNHQMRLSMKFEYQALLPRSGGSVAVLSSNLHGPTFGKAFKIKIENKVANTGCFGVGLERLALSIIEQHGVDRKNWPEGLRTDYEKWCSHDPVL